MIQRRRFGLAGESFRDRLHRCTRDLSGNADAVDNRYCFLGKEYFLENDWDVIIDKEGFTSEQIQQQSALWEFITTEKTYINRLKIIVNLFQETLRRTQLEGDLSEIEVSDVFANINEILEVNEHFWNNHVVPLLTKIRKNGKRIVPSELLNSFVKFSDMFKPYVQFCLFQKYCAKYIEDHRTIKSTNADKTEEVTIFMEWMSWCECLPQSNQLKLKNLLQEPRLRFMRYPLLLKSICEKSSVKSDIEFLTRVIEISEHFLQQNNNVLEIVSCLEEFEEETIMESDNHSFKSQFASVFKFLLTPLKTINMNRYILNRTSLKIIERRKGEVISVEALIFSDVVLFAKINKDTKKLKIVGPLYFLDKINILKSEGSVENIVFLYLDSFGLLASTCTLQIHRDKRDTWIAMINSAKIHYENTLAGLGTTFDFFEKSLSLNPHRANIKRTKIYYESTINKDDIISNFEKQLSSSCEKKSDEKMIQDRMFPNEKLEIKPDSCLQIQNAIVKMALPAFEIGLTTHEGNINTSIKEEDKTFVDDIEVGDDASSFASNIENTIENLRRDSIMCIAGIPFSRITSAIRERSKAESKRFATKQTQTAYFNSKIIFV